MAYRRHRNPTPDSGNLAPVLEVLLDDSLAVALDAKQVHWNVRGHGFRGLHKLFDEIHAAATEYADLIAERLAQFGVSTNPFPQGSKLPRTNRLDINAETCVLAMSQSLSKYSERLREAVRLAEDVRDAATVDILSEILRGSDKYLWLVEAYLGAPRFMIEENPPSRVTFGRMEKIDSSAAEMAVLLDGEVVGSISAEYKDVSSSRTREYRINAYLVDLHDVEEERIFQVGDHLNAKTALAHAKAWARERLEPKRRKNAFEAKPKKFHGRPAGGTHQLPGFHTASMRDQALPYAHQKGGAMEAKRPATDGCDDCDDDRCPACLRLWRISDYPVVVGVDMAGFTPEHDVDARHVGEILSDIAREALESDDPIGYFRHGDVEYNSVGSVEAALFQAMASHEEDPGGAFGSYLEDLDESEALAAIRAVAEGSAEADKILMRVIGQFRYLDDVPADRIVSVYYVKPFWDDILDVHDNEEDEERAQALESVGWDVLDSEDVMGFNVSGAYKRVFDRKPDADARVEWHGTGYRNLILAAPELADRLPKPPLPYEADA